MPFYLYDCGPVLESNQGYIWKLVCFAGLPRQYTWKPTMVSSSHNLDNGRPLSQTDAASVCPQFAKYFPYKYSHKTLVSVLVSIFTQNWEVLLLLVYLKMVTLGLSYSVLPSFSSMLQILGL